MQRVVPGWVGGDLNGDVVLQRRYSHAVDKSTGLWGDSKCGKSEAISQESYASDVDRDSQ